MITTIVVVVILKNFNILGPVSPLKMQRILKLNKKNVSAKKRKTGPMLMTTKTILDNFYQPYNQDMADLMKDQRYLFLE